jgi:hypothetical protein
MLAYGWVMETRGRELADERRLENDADNTGIVDGSLGGFVSISMKRRCGTSTS